MTSQKVQSRLIDQNKSIHENILNALTKTGMSVSSLDDFFSGVFKSLGVEVNSTYKVSELFKIFNDKNIRIVSVCGIECPGEINPEIRELLEVSTARKKIFGHILFSENSERDNFYKILDHMDESYTLHAAKILPSFTELNQSLTVRDRYTIIIFGKKEGDDPNKVYSVIAVEIS